MGCKISSDTIQIKKLAIPSSPSLSRDSENNLVSNSIGNIWYKDGVKIADTTQKIKPTTNGIYTATTTQNGCTSSISQGYYYLTNAVANLSNGEYFKVSPNPTSGELNIDYKFLSNKDVYISVVDINGRNVIVNKKINPGSNINLGSFSKGNYIIQVKDKTGRMITRQKLVKE
ncbi:MAG: T9SS type A sorting domain-containing protein [Bacteroidota bacterium]